MSTTDTEVSNLIVNKLTLSKYKELKAAGTLSETESYEITDIDTAIDAGGTDAANRSLSNLNTKGKNIANWSSNITNCITEIPQDIKLELADGTLTLKAGSKGYMGNGAVRTITGEPTLKNTGSAQMFLHITSGGTGLYAGYMSGGTVSERPSSPINYATYYNTSTQKCEYYNGSTWNEISLPIAVVTRGTDGFTSIDQVFNGFCYIGSTVFALPGVKGLAPNGRNADGSLKNKNIVLESVKNATASSAITNGYFVINAVKNAYIINKSTWTYDKDDNFFISRDNKTTEIFICGNISTDSTGRITSFTPKTAFHAVDYNDYAREVDNTVHKTGNETISGRKTFDGSGIGIIKSGSAIDIQNMAVDLSVTDGSVYGTSEIRFKDKKGIKQGVLEHQNRDRGDSVILMAARNHANTGWVTLAAGFDKNDTAFTNAPNPPSGSNNNAIATTNWCYDPAKSTNIVHRTGDETIAGTKTFTGNVNIQGLHMRVENPSTAEGGQISFASGNQEPNAGKVMYLDRYNGTFRFVGVNSGGTARVPLQVDIQNNKVIGVTPAASANDTQIATTAWVKSRITSSINAGNIGDIKYTSRTDVPNGGAWCDGALYTKAQFPDIYKMLVDGKIKSTTVSAFDSTVSASGSCGLFGLDTANTRFKVPLLKDVYLKAGQAPLAFGAESLPNITGSFYALDQINAYTGAFYRGATTTGGYGGGGAYDYRQQVMDASKVSSTYRDGAKVNPDHVAYRAYVVLYSSAVEASVAQATAFINELTNKANTNLSNISSNIDYVVESYNNGTSWYRIYKSGWIEQGGFFGGNTGSWSSDSITYLKPFKDTTYQLYCQGNWNDASSSSCKVTAKSTTGATITYANNLSSVQLSTWFAIGRK